MYELRKLVICTIWIIHKVCFVKHYLRQLFPGVYVSGMYSYFSELNQSLAGCPLVRLFLWADPICLQETTKSYLYVKGNRVFLQHLLQATVSSLLQTLSSFLNFFQGSRGQIQKIPAYILSYFVLSLLEKGCRHFGKVTDT